MDQYDVFQLTTELEAKFSQQITSFPLFIYFLVFGATWSRSSEWISLKILSYVTYHTKAKAMVKKLCCSCRYLNEENQNINLDESEKHALMVSFLRMHSHCSITFQKCNQVSNFEYSACHLNKRGSWAHHFCWVNILTEQFFLHAASNITYDLCAAMLHEAKTTLSIIFLGWVWLETYYMNFFGGVWWSFS